jgi:hypothetical protein
MMTDLFDVDGANLDRGFENLKAAELPIEQQLHAMLQEMWGRYEPYADPDFRQGFARDVDGRFWEMYLGCTLLEAGRTLLPVVERQREGGQPDLCVLEDGRRSGSRPLPQMKAHRVLTRSCVRSPSTRAAASSAAPIRQAQLRTSGAFWTKAQRIARYLEQGVIGPEDTRIIAISASRFGVYVADQPLPLIMTTLFPIGDAYITIDRETGNVVDEGFHPAPFIDRERNPIPRTAFLDERFADISGVIWSRVGLGNLSRRSRPLTYVHNPWRRFRWRQAGASGIASSSSRRAATSGRPTTFWRKPQRRHHDDAPECPRLAPSVP